MFRTFLIAAAIAVIAGLHQTASKAGDNNDQGDAGWRKVICYETVINYVNRQEPHTVSVTRYDSNGKPYQVYETHFREVKVPLTKVVPITKWVRVSE